MWKNWSPADDERLTTHFDLYNSTIFLWDFIERDICISDFQWNILVCTLKKVAWDNIKIQLLDGRTATIHLTQEGRKVYPIQSISTPQGEILYTHQDPSPECIHGRLDIDMIIAEEQAYIDRILAGLPEKS